MAFTGLIHWPDKWQISGEISTDCASLPGTTKFYNTDTCPYIILPPSILTLTWKMYRGSNPLELVISLWISSVFYIILWTFFLVDEASLFNHSYFILFYHHQYTGLYLLILCLEFIIITDIWILYHCNSVFWKGNEDLIIIIIIIIIIIKLSDNSLLIEHCTIHWTSFTAASVNHLWQSSPVKMRFDECRGDSSRPISDMVPKSRLLT